MWRLTFTFIKLVKPVKVSFIFYTFARRTLGKNLFQFKIDEIDTLYESAAQQFSFFPWLVILIHGHLWVWPPLINLQLRQHSQYTHFPRMLVSAQTSIDFMFILLPSTLKIRENKMASGC